MGAIYEISNHFSCNLRKSNIEIFLKRLIPENGILISKYVERGVVGTSSDGGYWKVYPQVIFEVKCLKSGETYRLDFITKEHFSGDVIYLCCGNSFYPFADIMDGDLLVERIDKFFNEGKEKELIIS